MTTGGAKHSAGVKIGAVLLDAAGTLIRPGEPVGETYAAVARQYGIELDAAKLAPAFVEVFAEMPALAFEWTSMGELQRLEQDWWRLLVHRVVSRAGGDIADFDAFFAALYVHYAQGHAWECFEEVPAVLDGLRARGCKLAVVSNFDSRLPGILKALDIREQVDAVVYSSAAGSAKPDPVIFAKALGTLDAAPQRTIHVGDSLRADVEGAAAGGLRGLLIDREHPRSGRSDRVISGLDELLIRLDCGRL